MSVKIYLKRVRNSQCREGDNIEVDVQVQNLSDEYISEEVKLRDIRERVVDSKKVHVKPDSQLNFTMEWETSYGDEGSGEITIETNDRSVSKEVFIDVGFW